MIFWNKLKTWVFQHKLLSGFLIILILIVFGLLVVSTLFVSLNDARTKTSPQLGAPMSPSFSESVGFDLDFGGLQGASSERYLEPASGGVEIEVKDANFTIDSNDAEAEGKIVREMSEDYGGYIERSNKLETNTILRVTMTARIPVDSFEEFIDKVQRNFDVDKHTIRNYRIPVQRELDELGILTRALGDYSKIREEINAMPVGQEKITLLMSVTNKELELKRAERTFDRNLATKERQGEFATITIMIEQKISAKLWPENVGGKFIDGFSQAIESTLDSIVSLSTVSISLFFTVIQWIIYILIVVVPVLFVYKILKPLYLRFWFKKSSKNNTETEQGN